MFEDRREKRLNNKGGLVSFEINKNKSQSLSSSKSNEKETTRKKSLFEEKEEAKKISSVPTNAVLTLPWGDQLQTKIYTQKTKANCSITNPSPLKVDAMEQSILRLIQSRTIAMH